MSSASISVIAALVVAMFSACTDDNTGSSQPDTIAPTIVATATVNGDTVTLSATTSDNVAVITVEFLIDSNAKATVTDTEGPSAFSTSVPVAALGNGSHVMVARAIDAAGNATTADTVTFQIGQPPVDDSPIKITATGVKDDAGVTFTVDIESAAQIDLTNFFLDGEFLGGRGDDQRHYVLSRVLSPGTHRFVVDVTDVDGNSRQAEVVIDV